MHLQDGAELVMNKMHICAIWNFLRHVLVSS